jgi:hypothetical protein
MAAASVAADYNSSTTHKWRLDDCISGKLNVRKGRPRVNKQALHSPVDALMIGYAVALAEMHRLLLGGNDSQGVRSVAKSVGLTIKVAKAAGVSPFDWKELRRAGVK